MVTRLSTMKRCLARRRQKREEKFGRLRDEQTTADATPALDAPIDKRRASKASPSSQSADHLYKTTQSLSSKNSVSNSLPLPSPLKKSTRHITTNLPRLSQNLPKRSSSDDETLGYKWNVQDNKLKPYPPYYPPICKNTSTYVGDSSPSVVASRIVECLKKRGASVEYDEDAATATVWTVERVNFMIYLHRGGRMMYDPSKDIGVSIKDLSTSFNSNLSNDVDDNVEVDFNHGVLVECSRLRGDVIAFHADCRAVLSSARGDSDGLDDHRGWLVAVRHSPFGFGRKSDRADLPAGQITSKQIMKMKDDDVPSLARLKRKQSTASLTHTVMDTLEIAASLLENDRWDAKLLGIQSLVILTDVRSSGIERAYLATLCILGTKDHSIRGERDSSVSRLHEKISTIIMKDPHSSRSFDFPETADDCDSMNVEETDRAEYSVQLRSCALILLINAMSNVVKYHARFPLLSNPSCDDYLSQKFIDSLADDLAGATRPPGPTVGCANESALAARLLYYLSIHAEKEVYLLNNAYVGTPPRPLYGLLEKVRVQGVLNHRPMELEAQLALSALDSDFLKEL